jgi:hypothetical protein
VAEDVRHRDAVQLVLVARAVWRSRSTMRSAPPGRPNSGGLGVESEHRIVTLDGPPHVTERDVSAGAGARPAAVLTAVGHHETRMAQLAEHPATFTGLALTPEVVASSSSAVRIAPQAG